MLKPGKTHKILYIEDCQEDIEAMQRALSSSSYNTELLCLNQLSTAREYIENLSTDVHSKDYPRIIFLDLRLHGQSSIELLKILKSSERILTVPVIVLSASEQDSDLIECCSQGATVYIKKPFKFSELKSQIQTTLDFWIGVAHLPRQWINLKDAK